MLTTDFVTGSPCWLDIGAEDPAATGDFYAAVLNWQAVPAGSDPDSTDGYAFFTRDDRIVAAFGRQSADSPPRWMIYFATSDAAATARAVEQAGGAVRSEPTAVGDAGRFAQCTDPLGAEFAVWQAGTLPGLQATDRPGALCWVELCTTGAAASAEFYRALFGWHVQSVPMPGSDGDDGKYTLIGTGSGEEQMHGGIVELPADQLAQAGGAGPYWHPVFAVENTDATTARVTDAGGTVSAGPLDAPGVGRLAVCRDPWDAEFVLLKPSREG